MNETAQPVPTAAAQKWSVATTVSSVVAAFLASVCCIGPLVFALLGIGGAGLLLKFEPYRPYFMVVTLALLGTGFYFTYRKPKHAVASGPECDCPAPGANRAGKIMLWIATVLVVGFLSFPYLAAWIWG
jgi:mercuric ion transport protein